MAMLTMAVMLAGCGGDSKKAAYPADGDISVIIPKAPGGGTDTSARGLIQFMEKDLKGYRVQNVIYPVQKLFSSGIMSGMSNAEFNDLVEEKLGGIFAELVSPEMDFRRAEDLETCKYCDFRKICGR